MTTFLLTWIFCMPEKSLSHRSKATPAGHPASPSGTEPFDRGPGSAGGPLGVRRSGTEPPVTTEGAKTVQESSQRQHERPGCGLLHANRWRLVSLLGAQTIWERVNKTLSSPLSQAPSIWLLQLAAFLLFSVRGKRSHSFIFKRSFFPPCPVNTRGNRRKKRRTKNAHYWLLFYFYFKNIFLFYLYVGRCLLNTSLLKNRFYPEGLKVMVKKHENSKLKKRKNKKKCPDLNLNERLVLFLCFYDLVIWTLSL